MAALRYLLATEEERRDAKSIKPVRWLKEVVQQWQPPSFGYSFKHPQSDATETRVDQVQQSHMHQLCTCSLSAH